MRTNGLLIVRNARQKRLLEEELFGQFSDGMWENTRGWEPWCACKVIVGENVGRTFFAQSAARCRY